MRLGPAFGEPMPASASGLPACRSIIWCSRASAALGDRLCRSCRVAASMPGSRWEVRGLPMAGDGCSAAADGDREDRRTGGGGGGWLLPASWLPLAWLLPASALPKPAALLKGLAAAAAAPAMGELGKLPKPVGNMDGPMGFLDPVAAAAICMNRAGLCHEAGLANMGLASMAADIIAMRYGSMAVAAAMALPCCAK